MCKVRANRGRDNVSRCGTPVGRARSDRLVAFKWVRNRGVAEVSVYAFVRATGAFVDKVPIEVGGPGTTTTRCSSSSASP